MNPIKKIAVLVFFLFLHISFFAQKTTVFTEANASYKRGMENFEKGLYGVARENFQNTLNLLQPANEPEYDIIKTKAELGIAKAAVRMGLPDGENLMLDFIRKNSPDPIANQALIEVANYYFNARKYDKAVDFFAMIPSHELSRDQRSEVLFKIGYAFFVKKKFKQAKYNFNKVKNFENNYYFPTNYYYGLCEFFEQKYDDAIKSFKIAEKSKKYRRHIPYYITQIYFAKGEFDKVIKYGEPKLNNSGLRKVKEIHQLVGQAYYEKGDFDKALPHLEYYVERSGKLRPEEFYQIGFLQYKAGKYKSAIKNFKQLKSLKSQLGQIGSFYLADCHLKSGDKNAAKNAFEIAANLNYNPMVKEEALINFAKLSYELKSDEDAITAAQMIKPGTKYYNEAQGILSEVFLSTKNYEKAIVTLENMPNKTPKMKETYQRVTYLRGLELMQGQRNKAAKKAFKKSINTPINQKTKALSLYWLGDISYKEKEYNASIDYLNQFLTLAKNISNLPDKASIYTANYTMGYNYIKQKKYTSALGFFQDAVGGITRNSMFIKSDMVKNNILGDATLRVGDCYFKKKKYKKAINSYNSAISKKYSGYVYALYQKATIQGLQNNLNGKASTLEIIAENHPNSEYADDALLALGYTHFERGYSKKAITALNTLITNYKNSNLYIEALLELGLIKINSGDPSSAIQSLKQIFTNNPEKEEAAQALELLEEIYLDANDPNGYTAFLETIPGYKIDNIVKDSINFKAATIQYANKNYKEAIKSFTKYIKKFPNGTSIINAHFFRGDCYLLEKQQDKALPDYEFIIRKGRSSKYLESVSKAASICYNLQKYSLALTYYEKLDQESSDAKEKLNAQIGAMHCAYKTKNNNKIYQLTSKVFSNSGSTKRQKSIARFYQGKMAFDNNNFDDALPHFNYVEKNSNEEFTAESVFHIAEIYYNQRDLSVAQGIAEQAFRKNKDEYTFWAIQSMLLLADVSVELEDYTKAKGALEYIIEKYTGKDEKKIIAAAQAKLSNVNQLIERSNRLELEEENSFLDESEDN